MGNFNARKNQNYDAACFHAQQCAEKYLKARLQEASIRFRKTHDLEILLNDVLAVEPSWTSLAGSADFLTVYAVKFRYPGDSADKIEAKEAVENRRSMRNTIRQSFGLSIK